MKFGNYQSLLQYLPLPCPPKKQSNGWHPRKYGERIVSSQWPHTLQTHPMTMSQICQALDAWQPAHMPTQRDTWNFLAWVAKSSHHKSSPLPPTYKTLGSFHKIPHLTSRHLDTSPLTSARVTLLFITFSPDLGSHFVVPTTALVCGIKA
jgi:hypothetical protein